MDTRSISLLYGATFLVGVCLFDCAEVLWPSQPNGVMSSAVSLSNRPFTMQS